MPVTYLDRIIADHRRAADDDGRKLDRLLDAAAGRGPRRGFRAALEQTDEIAVISEIKRRSPSKGELRPELDPVSLARLYADGGAACLSVLTDEVWFGGSETDLREARSAVDLPVLRKDFTVDARDVADAALMGADCVLLIVAALDDTELADFHRLALELGLDALVEVHDEAELERALAVDSTLIGVNQRDLVTFEVDQHRAERLAPMMPPGVVRVAESGVRGPEDSQLLAEAGYHALLVGESLLVSADPAEALRALRGK